MTFAIHLDDELAVMTNEIDDIATHGRLTPKPKSTEAMRFQMPPQQCLGTRHRAS